jgi:hypothetical protein
MATKLDFRRLILKKRHTLGDENQISSPKVQIKVILGDEN